MCVSDGGPGAAGGVRWAMWIFLLTCLCRAHAPSCAADQVISRAIGRLMGRPATYVFHGRLGNDQCIAQKLKDQESHMSTRIHEIEMNLYPS